MVVQVAGRPVAVSAHAVERYRERFRPALDAAQADADLRRLLSSHGAWEGRPEWASGQSAGWWLVAGEVAFPVERAGGRFFAVTCLGPGHISAEKRAGRNARNARRRGRAQGKRRGIRGKGE